APDGEDDGRPRDVAEPEPAGCVGEGEQGRTDHPHLRIGHRRARPPSHYDAPHRAGLAPKLKGRDQRQGGGETERPGGRRPELEESHAALLREDHGLPRPIPGRGRDNAHTAEAAVGDYTTGRADPRKGAVRLPRGSAWRRFIALQRSIQRGKAPAADGSFRR